jgi:dipeptidyl aminopeptidase/acylaminoacyl peptidase
VSRAERLLPRSASGLLAAALAAAVAFGGEPRVAPIPVETALNVSTFADYGPVDLSPDGKWVAYTLKNSRRVVTDPDPRYHYFTRTGASIFGLGGDVWITNTETGESRNLTGRKGSNWYPVWSPDGRSLAFFSDREGKANLWVWESGSGRLRRLSDRIIRGTGGQTAAWTSDGRELVVLVLPEGMTIEKAAELFGPKKASETAAGGGATVTVFDSRKEKEKATAWSTDALIGDLVSVDVAGGGDRRLTEGRKPVGGVFSPDGTTLAFADAKGFAPGKDFQPRYDICVVDRKGAPHVLVPDVPLETGHEITWALDSKTLFYTTGGESPEGKKTDCYAVDVAGGKPRLLTVGSHPEFKGYFGQPLLDAAGRFVYHHTEDALWRASVSGAEAKKVAELPGRQILGILAFGGRRGRFWPPDGGNSLALLARDKETKRVAACRVNLDSGATETLVEEEKYFSDPLGVAVDASEDGKKVVFVTEDAAHPEDLWVAGSNLQGARRLTHINPGFDDYRMGAVRILDWTALDGARMRGALLLPSNYREGTHYPVVVYPYGGADLSNRRYAFGLSYAGPENMQLLATRGYAVFLPDTKTRLGTPMRDVADSVLSGVAKLIDSGVADPNRLGVMGHSYGGYSVLALIVQSQVFKAAIDRAGPGDLSGSYGDMGRDGTALNVQWAEGGQGMMGGSPWEFRSRYIENSPYFYFDRVQTPLLIIHGAEDQRVPVKNADQVFVSLRRLGKDVVYARYEGEDHSELYWGYANQRDYCERMIAWFDEHLKTGKSEGASK